MSRSHIKVMHRFYSQQPFDTDEIELSGDEAHHLIRVLRLGPGDRVELFDGSGSAVAADVITVSKRLTTLQIVERHPIDPPRVPHITLLTAAPKSDRLRWLVEKATELGVDRLSLVRTERSVVLPGDGKLDKLRMAVIAACKQSGRNDLMQIDPLSDWQAAVESTCEEVGCLLLATPNGTPIGNRRAEIGQVDRVAIGVGPEGGLSDDEVRFAVDCGAVPVGLGGLILRIETACLSAVSAVRLTSCNNK